MKPESVKIKSSLNLASAYSFNKHQTNRLRLFKNMPLNIDALGFACHFPISEAIGWESSFLNQFQNAIFVGKLCSDQNNTFRPLPCVSKPFFLKKTAFAFKNKQNTNMGLKRMFLNSNRQKPFAGRSYDWFLNKIPRPAGFFFNSSRQKALNKKGSGLKGYDGDHFNLKDSCLTPRRSGGLDSCLLNIKVNVAKFNNLNFIQKRRLKIQPLLRIPTQKISSLNKFQIALGFSKIWQPWASNSSILFNDNYCSSLFPKIYNDRFHYAKNELEPAKTSETQFLNDNIFGKPSRENDDLDYYNSTAPLKKNSYMKTQFFQHIAWNMKPKIGFHPIALPSVKRLEPEIGFSDVKDSFHTNDLPIKNTDSFFTKPSKIISYHQEKPSFSTTNNHEFLKMEKGSGLEEDLNTMVFLNKSQSDNFLTNYENRQSILQNDFAKKPPKFGQASPVVPLQANVWGGRWWGSNLIVYGGSWYSENLALPYNIFSRLPINDKNHFYFFKNKTGLFNEIKQTKQPYSALRGGGPDTLSYLNPIKSTIRLNNNHNSKTRQCFHPEGGYLYPTVHGKAESDIGIYSLAHKLSSIGFHNGNSEIDIYPFKYNDSYRYNFQNMNLSNHRLKSFLKHKDFISSSNLKNQTKDASIIVQAPNVSHLANVWGGGENTKASDKTYYPNFGKFLNCQNPTLSKIYAPLFQPQNLNLLSFI